MAHIKFRVTDYERDKAKLNRAFALVEQLENEVHHQREQIELLRKQQIKLAEQRTTAGANDLTFTWTDATTTISWAAGFIRDHGGERVLHVPAGSRAGLTANTFYWAGWNPVHQTMSFEKSIDTLNQVKNIVIVCRIQTGNGANGTAGGGGSEAGGDGILNKEYLFTP